MVIKKLINTIFSGYIREVFIFSLNHNMKTVFVTASGASLKPTAYGLSRGAIVKHLFIVAYDRTALILTILKTLTVTTHSLSQV